MGTDRRVGGVLHVRRLKCVVAVLAHAPDIGEPIPCGPCGARSPLSEALVFPR